MWERIKAHPKRSRGIRAPFLQKIVGVLVSTNFVSQSKFRPNPRLSRDFLVNLTGKKYHFLTSNFKGQTR
jgi:hypothetical protein